MFRFVGFSLAFALTGFAAAHRGEESCPEGKQHYRATIRHIESGGIGYENGYTTLEAFFSSDPSRWSVTPFLDARGHIFDDGRWAANAGAGLRALFGRRAYGINAYYDYRNGGRLNAHQIGVGLETLGELFDFRLNGYLPVGHKLSSPYDPAFAAFSGHYLIVSQKYQSAMKGADAEFGFHFGKSALFDFYAAAGPYYFIGKVDPATWGGKARVLATFKERLTAQISDSYDRTFHNKFQGEISLHFPLGPKSKVKRQGLSCQVAEALNSRMVQPVERQEIIVIDKAKKKSPAIDPATGLPYFFVFVDNTSSSNGTYESPYHTFAQAQANSSPNDVIYVFPGDGTTAGMNSGISLQAGQKFWGSGVTHSLETSTGSVSIPAQTPSSPVITNSNVDTEGNAVTLAANNAVSGFTIASALNDAIYGVNLQSLDVSYCTFQNITTFPIEASFPGSASLSVMNNQFLSNVNGIFCTLNGTSSLVYSNNAFRGQTSVSDFPMTIVGNNNRFNARITNNVFDGNRTGAVRFSLQGVADANVTFLGNVVNDNETGSQGAGLGSNLVILSSGTIGRCSVALEGNAFTGNESSSLYFHTDGQITRLEVAILDNTMTDNGGGALVLATPVNLLTLAASDNTIRRIGNNGIGLIASGVTSSGNIAIRDNIITDVSGDSNGIAISQNFAALDWAVEDNEISRCTGTGILAYPSTGFNGSVTLALSGNTVSDCDNGSSNASSAIDIENYTSLLATMSDNTLTGNAGTPVAFDTGASSSSVCLTLTGNSNDGEYRLTNPVDGVFDLSPINASSVNVGTITTSGVINSVTSCPDGVSCPLKIETDF